MTKPPPVPPDNLSHKGTGDAKSGNPSQATRDQRRATSTNLNEQGDQANIKQNTTHQGLQQDR